MQRRWYLGISTSNHQNKKNNKQINQTNQPTKQLRRETPTDAESSKLYILGNTGNTDVSVNGFLSQTTEIPRQQSDVAGMVKYKTNSPSSQCQILHPVKNIHLISKRRRHQAVSDGQKPSRHNQHKMLREILQDKQRQRQTSALIGEKEWVRAPATARRDETEKSVLSFCLNTSWKEEWLYQGKYTLLHWGLQSKAKESVRPGQQGGTVGQQNHTLKDSCVKRKNSWGPQHHWCPGIWSIEMMESQIRPAAPRIIGNQQGAETQSVGGVSQSSEQELRDLQREADLHGLWELEESFELALSSPLHLLIHEEMEVQRG